jgi:hypothetical protein
VLDPPFGCPSECSTSEFLVDAVQDVVVINFFDSLDAVKRFAGPDYTRLIQKTQLSPGTFCTFARELSSWGVDPSHSADAFIPLGDVERRCSEGR